MNYKTPDDNIKIVGRNYWLEAKKNLTKILERPFSTILLVNDSIDITEIAAFIDRLPYSTKGVYISMTKSFEAVNKTLESLKSKVFVVDCVSAAFFDKPSTNKVDYITPPSDLSGMIKLFQRYVDSYNPDYLILDSFSQMIDISTTQKKEELHRFYDDLKAMGRNSLCRFILLYDKGLSNKLNNLPVYEVDILLYLEVIREKVRWTG